MKSMKLKNEIEIALFAVLLAVFSWTTIPFAVPFTLPDGERPETTTGAYGSTVLNVPPVETR